MEVKKEIYDEVATEILALAHIMKCKQVPGSEPHFYLEAEDPSAILQSLDLIRTVISSSTDPVHMYVLDVIPYDNSVVYALGAVNCPMNQIMENPADYILFLQQNEFQGWYQVGKIKLGKHTSRKILTPHRYHLAILDVMYNQYENLTDVLDT